MTDFTYNIPNSIQNIPDTEQLALYIRYPGNPSEWKRFVVSADNKHQLEGLKLFVDAVVESNVESMDISIPHSISGMFNVKFRKLEPLNERYNPIYQYITEKNNKIQLMVSYGSQVGHINRLINMY